MIVALVIGALLFGAAIVVFVFIGVLKTENDQTKAEKNADTILDSVFDGRPDVTYTTHMRNLKPDTVILGAKARGYRLVTHVTNQYGTGPMIFEKHAD